MARLSGIAVAAITVGASLAGCGRATSISPGSAPARADVTISLTPYQGRLRTVSVRAAGRKWRLLLDTGGGLTLVSPALAEALHCAARGRAAGHRMTGEEFVVPTCVPSGDAALEIGGWKAPAQTLGIYDVMALLPKDWPRLDGIVSLRSFAGQRLTVDLTANALTVLGGAPSEPRNALGTPLLGRLATGSSGGELLSFIGTPIGADTLWLEVDSGNLDDLLLAPHAARLLGVADSIGAEIPAVTLRLAAGEAPGLRARVRGLIHDGALNAAWLAQGRLTIDLRDGRVWWERSR